MRVHFREFLQSLDDREAYEIVDGDVRIYLAICIEFLGLLAELLNLTCVSSQHMRELSGILQGIVHGLGDELAHVGHFLDRELFSFARNIGVRRLPNF